LDAEYAQPKDFGRGNLVERCPLAFVPDVQMSGVAFEPTHDFAPTAS
jgi:hypothetical protein